MEQAATLAEALGLESYIADARIAASRSTPDTDKAIAETQDVIAGLRDDLGTEENPAPGYAGMVAIAPKAAVDLWWKGHLPTSVETVIASYRERLKINVHKAPYSRDDLRKAIEGLWATDSGAHAFAPKQDGTGIVVAYDSKDAPNIGMTTIDAATDVPLTFVDTPALVPVSGDRQHDVGPHYGGASILRGDGGICSTGFAVLRGSTGYLLSAAHCNEDPLGSGQYPWHWFYNGNLSNPYLIAGPADQERYLPLDALLLDPRNGTAGRVWDGGIWSGSYNRKVAQAIATGVGDTVATSGANSGSHHGLYVMDAQYSTVCNHQWNCELVLALELNPNAASVVAGDSGGPVFNVRSGGRVNARGIIIGGSNRVACPPTRFNVAPDCYNHVGFARVRRVMDIFNVNIETTP